MLRSILGLLLWLLLLLALLLLWLRRRLMLWEGTKAACYILQHSRKCCLVCPCCLLQDSEEVQCVHSPGGFMLGLGTARLVSDVRLLHAVCVCT